MLSRKRKRNWESEKQLHSNKKRRINAAFFIMYSYCYNPIYQALAIVTVKLAAAFAISCEAGVAGK